MIDKGAVFCYNSERKRGGEEPGGAPRPGAASAAAEAAARAGSDENREDLFNALLTYGDSAAAYLAS